MATLELILSTSNIIDAGSLDFSRAGRSNAELVKSLRSNFQSHNTATDLSDSNNTSKSANTHVNYRSWTSQRDQTLEIPRLDPENHGLLDERDEYDITLKLFFLPQSTTDVHETQARQALDLVLKELGVKTVDLLILSLPGVYFDEGEDSPEKIGIRESVETQAESLENQLQTWKAFEKLHDENIVKRLGIAEFGCERLSSFLKEVRLKPNVDQINLRDCCSVPKDLLGVARKNGIDLLVHNDCSNILPKGTVRELLGSAPNGAGVLAGVAKTGAKRKTLHDDAITNGHDSEVLHGELHPQWVVKYTAVVKSRGVVENKGYFAMAKLVP